MSLTTRFNSNIQAIKIIKGLKGSPARLSERNVLKKYSGWGGFSSFFSDPENSDSIEQLKSLVSSDEYESLYQGVLHSFYTPAALSDFIFDCFKKAGITQNHKVLDPAVGLGSLVLPWVGKAKIDAVEKDSLTAQIMAAAHPEIHVLNKPFESADDIELGAYDALVSNPPYGDFRVFDALDKRRSKLPIHEYFALKSLDYLKPDGVMALVVTSSLLDKSNDSTRRELMQNASLLGAWRLPTSTFKDTNTSVSTDLILLKKRSSPVLTDSLSDLESEFLKTPIRTLNHKSVCANSLIFDQVGKAPDMFQIETSKYGTKLVHKEALSTALQNLDVPAFKLDTKDVIESVDDGLVRHDELGISKDDLSEYPQFSYRLHEKRGCYVQRITSNRFRLVEEIEIGSAKEKRLKIAFALAKKLKQVQTLENTQCDETELDLARQELSSQYELFVKRCGAVNASKNRFLMEDNELLNIFGLEKAYQPAISQKQADTRNCHPQKESWERADILSQRVYFPIKFNEYAFTPKQALTMSLIKCGGVNLNLMAECSPFSIEQLKKSLVGDSIFFDPQLSEYVVRDQYLSGNVRAKYKFAQNHGIQDNIEALKQALPFDVLPHQLEVPFLAGWLPVEIIKDFTVHITGKDIGSDVKKAFGRFYAELSITAASQNDEFGTTDLLAHEILAKLINKTPIVVNKKVKIGSGETIRVPDETATYAALEKADAIKREWRNFIFSDVDRVNKLTELYNDTVNCYVVPKFNGQHLTIKDGVFKGQSSSFLFRPHQVNAIWRQIVQRGGLAAHEVGSGKTATACAVAYLGVEMGIFTNPVLTVPGNVLTHWYAEMMRVFPNAKVLLVDELSNSRNSATRRRMLARIKSSRWHAVIMTHETFTSIQMPVDGLREAVADLKMAAYTPTNVNESSRTGRAIARKLESIENNAEKAIAKATRIRGYGFEELNSSLILVDEADLFKNAQFVTGFYSVKGLGDPLGSGRAFDMMAKARHVNRKHNTGSRGVGFYTGTPISNSVSETFTLARYLYNDVLHDAGLGAFDAFITTYSSESTEYEFNSTGGFKLETRFRDFVNLSELQAFFHNFTDAVSNDYLIEFYEKTGKVWPVPKLVEGQTNDSVQSPDECFMDYNSFLIERGENLGQSGDEFFKAHYPNDNKLAIISSSRSASMDLRLEPENTALAGINLTNYESPKTDSIIQNVMSTFDEYNTILNGERTAQIIFVDVGTPKDDSDKFSVYEDIKIKLIAAGLAPHEIAFIHEAKNSRQRDILFERVRKAEVRVLIASTQKAGAGTNIQDRLIAIHHVTLDWKPRALTQQLGRILRQGNIFFMRSLERFYAGEIEKHQLFAVRAFRYAIENSLDVMMIQANEIKQKFISAFLSDDFSNRKITLRDESSVDFSEFKARASGRPELMLKVKNDQILRRLFAMKDDFDRKQRHSTWKLESLPYRIADTKSRIDYLENLRNHSSCLELLSCPNFTSRFFSKGRGPSDYNTQAGLLIHLVGNLFKNIVLMGCNDTCLFRAGSGEWHARVLHSDEIELVYISGGVKLVLCNVNSSRVGTDIRDFIGVMGSLEDRITNNVNNLNADIEVLKHLKSKTVAEFSYNQQIEDAKALDRRLSIAIETGISVVEGVDVTKADLVDLDNLLSSEKPGHSDSALNDEFQIKILATTSYESLAQNSGSELLSKQKAKHKVESKIETIEMFGLIEGKNGQLGLDI